MTKKSRICTKGSSSINGTINNKINSSLSVKRGTVALVLSLFLILFLTILSACTFKEPAVPKETNVTGGCTFRLNNADVPTLCKYAYQCEIACRDICQTEDLYYKTKSYKTELGATKNDVLCKCVCTDIPTRDSRVVADIEKPEGYDEAVAKDAETS